MLSEYDKRILINEAQKLFRECSDEYIRRDPALKYEWNMRTYAGTCEHVSHIVHFLAKERLKVSDENNLIMNASFKNERMKDGTSHFYCIINGIIVDATIKQFGDEYEPYSNSYDMCYIYDPEKNKVLFNPEEIPFEIEKLNGINR